MRATIRPTYLRARSAVTGRFIPMAEARRRKRTSVIEEVEGKPRKIRRRPAK